ncbi:hypothetical protein [Streptomyces chromofuscus]|uniref:Ribbon-helix-helix protein CopG domain-containing protein n=1 Tax=Streptomyces chromofuscus TaxID=42881 RepID=A0A7M2TGP1_STRCW|nr:hypothetical protein [Streptomyces chromofuscus]QOV47917.1 hypothetical protein IPT68_14250 [Streptomyces chromofuscus]GGT14627.1 hypothetical protein GCM10010254_39190 [Streptomyces chromofuscus]
MHELTLPLPADLREAVDDLADPPGLAACTSGGSPSAADRARAARDSDAPLALPLPADLREAVDDLADACGRGPEDIALEAVRAHVRGEGATVRAAAERLASPHAELLPRLGE